MAAKHILPPSLIVLLGKVMDEETRQPGRLALGLVAAVSSLAAIRHESAADIRIRRGVLEVNAILSGSRPIGVNAHHIDVDRLSLTVQQSELSVVVLLPVIDRLETEGVVHERLGQRRIERVEVLPL